MKYKISVAIPVYNAEDTLERAIESILSQNWNGNLFEDIEIILVDDNSSDLSLEIIKKYSDNYDNIKYHSFNNNSGYGGRGRNKGIELSEGEYIIFMDNDDIYLQNAFKTMYAAIIEEDADFVSFTIHDSIFKEKHVICPKKYGDKFSVKPTKTQHTFDSVSTNSSYAPWAKIYSRKFLIENNIWFVEDSQFDDADFYIKCILNANKYSFRPNDAVYMYFTYEDSQVRLHDKLHFDARLFSLKEIVNMIESHDLLADSFVNHCFNDFLLIFANANEPKDKKIEMLQDLYDFEINYDIDTRLFELNFLNGFIRKKHFNMAIIVSNAYIFLYNNNFIRKLYRMRNFRKWTKQRLE